MCGVRIQAGAELFIGNMLSTFSTNVAAIRYANGEKESILAWPEPKSVTKSFWVSPSMWIAVGT